MKLKCDICEREFSYPYELNHHKHSNLELDGVPVNFWTLIIEKEKNRINKYNNIFKYCDYPFVKKHLSLGEGNTPLIELKKGLYIKDESVNPTGSFKDRGMPLLMNEALYFKKDKIAICSTGNAAISLINYSKKYKLKSIVFVPKDISEKKKEELSNSSKIYYSDNIIKCFEDFFEYCNSNDEVFNGFLSTNQSYFLGLGTISYEIFEQLNYSVPDYIFIPCASGGNVVAQYNVWKKLLSEGLISRMPKLIFVQIEGGNPIEQGFKKRIQDELYIIKDPIESKTILSSDTCFNYFKIYKMIEEGSVIPISISDNDINNLDYEDKNKYDFTSLAALSAYKKFKDKIDENEIVVVIMTAKNRGDL